jgi:hypothetical protein
MMIHVLRYEPRGQRQRFEPREQQDRHIHLHFHLNLTFRASQERSTQPNAIRITRIFAALVGASVMAVGLFLPVLNSGPSTTLFFFTMNIILAGLALAWGTVWLGGLPLVVSAWRSTPRVRFGLSLPFVPLLLTPILLGLISVPWLGPILAALSGTPFFNSIWFSFLVFYGYPLTSVLMINRAIRRAAIPDKQLRFASRLSFVVVGGIALMLLGALLWGLTFLPLGPGVIGWLPWSSGLSWSSWLPYLLGICLAFIVAVSMLFSRPRSHDNAQPKQEHAIDEEQPQAPYPEQEPPRPRSS